LWPPLRDCSILLSEAQLLRLEVSVVELRLVLRRMLVVGLWRRTGHGALFMRYDLYPSVP
jgi:hypothetical protein